MEKINLLGIYIDYVDSSESVEFTKSLLKRNGKHLIFTPNSNLMVKAIEDSKFANVLNKASLSIPDGMPLVMISKWFGTPLKEKVSGSSYFISSLRAFSKEGKSIFFLGGRESVLLKITERIKKEEPNANIVGHYSPPMFFEKKEETLNQTIDILKDNPVDVLYVAASGGRGEIFLADHIDQIPAKIAIQVGAAFDFYSGEVASMPEVMKKLGIGWLFRLFQSPKRMFKRYFLHDIKIFKYALKHKLSQK